MCPKMNNVKPKILITSNSSTIERIKYKILEFHRITIAAIILYIIFVILFIIINGLMCIWNVKVNRRRKYLLASKNLLFYMIKIFLGV